MAQRKINPFLLFFPGMVLIAVALASLAVGWWSGKKDEDTAADIAKDLPESTVKPITKKEFKKDKKIAVEKPADSQLQREISAAERSAEMNKIILDQIHKSPATLDLKWLAGFCQYIRNEESLERYFGEILERGAKQNIVYIKDRKKRKMAPSSNPFYFLEEAKDG
jgi:hypothetical protein